MECQKIISLLDTTSDNLPRFITKKQVEGYGKSGGSCNIYEFINIKYLQYLSMLISGLCGYSATYILVKGTVTVADPNNDAYDKKNSF